MKQPKRDCKYNNSFWFISLTSPFKSQYRDEGKRKEKTDFFLRKHQGILFLSNHNVCIRVSFLAKVMPSQKLFVKE